MILFAILIHIQIIWQKFRNRFISQRFKGNSSPISFITCILYVEAITLLIDSIKFMDMEHKHLFGIFTTGKIFSILLIINFIQFEIKLFINSWKDSDMLYAFVYFAFS